MEFKMDRGGGPAGQKFNWKLNFLLLYLFILYIFCIVCLILRVTIPA